MMQRWLENIKDILEIILNFLVVFCLETAADASFGMLQTPIWELCLPVLLPLLFYGFRRWVGNFVLFIILHPIAAALLFAMAGSMPFPVLWKIVFAVIGAAYAFHSIKIRIVQKLDGEGEIPAVLAGCLFTASFFLCSYVHQNAGSERVLWIFFLWLLGYLLKNYLENFLSYVNLSRRTAGAMPEKSIFRAGMTAVCGYSSVSVLLLILCAKTPMMARLSELVGEFGRFLLRGLFWFVMLFAQGEGETGAMEETAVPLAEQMQESPGMPVWLQIFNWIFNWVVTIALIVGAVFLIILLIRWMIRTFYEREKRAREIVGEGYLEEEERLDRTNFKKGKRLPFIGGTTEEKVRRVYKKTVQGACPEESGLEALTVREIAGRRDTECREEWENLSDIYERARYAQEGVTREDLKAAGKLSREILHSIK